MKKLLIATNVFFLSIILFQACGPTHVAGDASGSFAINTTTASSSCYNCANNDMSTQTVADFIDVVSRYYQTHYRVVNAYAVGGLNNNSLQVSNGSSLGEGFKDARSCWFSTDTLKKFICLMEKYSSQLTTPIPPSKLGIRFYYATYKKIPWNPSFGSHHTLFLAATREMADGSNEDFDPQYSATHKVQLKNGIQSLAAMVADPALRNQEIFGFLQKGAPTPTTGPVKNQGDLCPPNCSGSYANGNSTMQQVDNINPYGLGFNQ